MNDPDFVAAIMANKVHVVGTYLSSPEYQRLNQATGGLPSQRGNGVIELGFDFAQPYNFVQHSTGLLFFRCVMGFALSGQQSGDNCNLSVAVQN